MGLEVIAAQRGERLERGYRDRARRRRWQLTNRANLAHLVGVNGFFTALAGNARTRPGCELARWWSARQCQQTGAFANSDAGVDQRLYTPKSRPDGYGVWVEDGSQVSFFLEYDTGTERPISAWSTRSTDTKISPASPGSYGRCCSGCPARSGSAVSTRN